MIFDKIENIDCYRGIVGIYDALCWLSEQVGLPSEKTEISSAVEVFANKGEFISKSAEDVDFETHDKYIDIHFIVEGIEGIGITQRAKLTPKGGYNADNDITFYDGKEAETTFWLEKGSFLVCFPTEGHRPGTFKDAPAPVKKIVVKIKA